MLRNYPVHPTVAVTDLARARRFYEKTLGFVPALEFPGGVFYDCAHGTRLMLYQSEFAGTNRATCASFIVKDLTVMVADLKKKGVAFESYDVPGFDSASSIARMGDYNTAWFKDPENNIFAISQMSEER